MWSRRTGLLFENTSSYWRYDTLDQLRIINQIYQKLSFYQNYFQPVMKLKEKIRVGPQVRRIYDQPKTPFRRLLEAQEVDQDTKDRLLATYETLNPKQLLKEITQLVDYLLRA